VAHKVNLTACNKICDVAKASHVVSPTISSREKGYCSAGVMENTALTNIETVALVVDKPGSGFKLTPIVFDEVRDDEYLVEMMYSGICHTVHLIILFRVTNWASANITLGSAPQRWALWRRLQISSNLWS
jgi:hypothetical protein